MVTKRSLYYWVFHKNAKLQALLVVIILVTVAARVLPLEMQKRIINQAIGMKNLDALFLYCGFYIAAVILAGVLKYAINLLQGYIGQRTLMEIRRQLFEHILSLPLPFFRRTSPGLVVSSLMSELESMATFVGSALSAPLVNILTFISFGAYMFWLNPLLAALSISIYPIEMIIIPMLQKRYNITNRKRTTCIRENSSLITESVAGIHEVQGNASVALEGRKFGRAIDTLYRLAFRLHALKFGIKFTNNFFQSLGPFILFIVGGWLSIKGRFDLGALVAFLSAYEKVYDPWKELMEFYQLLQDTKVRYKQVMDYFDIEPEAASQPEGRAPYSLAGNIEVQDLSYTVSGNVKLLDRMNLKLAHGEHMALVGFSGSGKSTLAKAIAQQFRYTAGHIYIDGKEVRNLTRRDLAENMGIVAQHPFIFDGTIYDNLLYSCDALLEQQDNLTEENRKSLDRTIEVVQQVGLFIDVLRFGLRSRLKPEENPELMESIIRAREQFQVLHGDDLSHDIEFFDEGAFLRYASLAENIVFGAPEKPEFNLDVLSRNPLFLEFLNANKLRDPLENFGLDMAQRTVELIRNAGESEELFEKSPIARDEFEAYATMVDRVAARTAAESAQAPDEKSRQLMLDLALRIVPASHKLAPVPSSLSQLIPSVRKAFREFIDVRAPETFTFYSRAEYLSTQSLQDNIIFGHVKTDSAGAEERVSQRIMQLLIVENVLEHVVEIGLLFNVGSMGDRLSGGQRQKIALARAFLKEPPILILDEATSALDNASQTRIQNLLEKKWKGRSSVISVVHRLDTLKSYDKVAVLKAGKILEQGPYEELLARKGALYELVNGSK